MTESWATSVQGLGNGFEAVRKEASRLAAQHRCWFWWMPEADGWHRFVFTNHNVSTLFDAYLRTNVVKNDGKRIKRMSISPEEIGVFADHCTHIRSVWTYAIRIFQQRTEAEDKAINAVAPLFFEDLDQVFSDFAITSACRVTDPWIDAQGRKNFTIGYFTNALERHKKLHGQLVELQKRMEEHRDRIVPARNKLTAHADLETILANKRLGTATWPQWDQFWKDLEEFVSLVHQYVCGSPREIRAAMVLGDAEMILKKMQSYLYG
jgi:hypothetical protein